MNKDIKKIIESLDKASANYGKAKYRTAGWTEELGFQKQTIEAQKIVWKDLEKVGDIPTQVVASATVLSQHMLRQSEQIVASVENSQIGKSIVTGSSSTEAMSGATISSVFLKYANTQLPSSYYSLEDVVSQRSYQEPTSQKLRAIDESLADEYDNAWAGLRLATKDETRSPMFLIREVINRLYHHYAPDDETRRFHELNSKTRIERAHRVEYIASKMDQAERQTFLAQKEEFGKIYEQLNKAHKHGKLKAEETRGFLYQADALIRLLLNVLHQRSD